MKKLSLPAASLAAALACLAVLFPLPVLAQNSGYDISSYHTDIQIDNDNTYHVSESITADFHEPKHGIFRYIPNRQEMTWNIGGQSKTMTYNTPVGSIQITGAPFKTSREGGNTVLQIGSASQTVTGTKEYGISYEHVLGNDKIASQDFVYYNLVGPDWDCDIRDITFSVTLPKAFDESKIWFFYGSYGSNEQAPVEYTVDGNTITGNLKASLAPGESLTLQMDLPEGYFETPRPFPWQTVMIVSGILLAAGGLILFLLFGRDGRLITPVEFNAPEEITSAEAGYIIDTSADDKDVVSLILYWASKGYLAIEKISENDFRLYKKKDLPQQAYQYEKYMFGNLFSGRDSVSISQLKDQFYETVEMTKSLVADHYATKENRLYSSGSRALGWILRAVSVLFLGFSLYIPIYELTYTPEFSLMITAIATIILILPLVFLDRILLYWQATRRAKRSFSLLAACILTGVAMLLFILFMAIRDMWPAGVTAASVTVFLYVTGIFMRQRTKRGSELLGRLLGFKNFLERAERSRIERLAEETPTYFYDVLPFAYVLGVSDKWAKNFEGITTRPPDWYHDRYGRADVFSPLLFQSYLFHSMAMMRASMISRPVQTNLGGGGRSGFGGGGFGGGGFSGGGFGGGGGGSW